MPQSLTAVSRRVARLARRRSGPAPLGPGAARVSGPAPLGPIRVVKLSWTRRMSRGGGSGGAGDVGGPDEPAQAAAAQGGRGGHGARRDQGRGQDHQVRPPPSRRSPTPLGPVCRPGWLGRSKRGRSVLEPAPPPLKRRRRMLPRGCLWASVLRGATRSAGAGPSRRRRRAGRGAAGRVTAVDKGLGKPRG